MTEPDYRGRAAAGITALQRWYRPGTGLWAGTGWWNSANALTAVIRYTKLTGDASHAGVITTTFAAAQRQHAGFVNTYYDDNAWWALAWIAAFDLTRDDKGVFVRYLYDFWLHSRQPAYRGFILANASSVWEHGRNAAGQFGLHWSGPFDKPSVARQASALDALIAAAALAG